MPGCAMLRGVQVDIGKTGVAARDALLPSFKKVLRQTQNALGFNAYNPRLSESLS